MNLGAISHNSFDNYVYPLDEDRLVINIKTGLDVDKVYIFYGDPFKSGLMGSFNSWQGTKEEIKSCTKLKYNKFWSITVTPEFKRCRYYFMLVSDNEAYYMLEDGFKSEEEMKNYKGRRQDFFFPWMNPADINKPPMWVNNTIWYQIFPDRFCRVGDKAGKNKIKPWAKPDQKMNHFDFYGGNIKGIISKLDYLQSLGITGIYTTPLNESNSNHKYDTTDYFKIDSDFGTNDDMKEFVREAHKRNIRVMIDGVFNHCGKDFAPWKDVIEKGYNSKYISWFIVKDWPFNKTGNNARSGKYYSFAFQDSMPKLNTNNPEVINYIINICSFWVKEYDIDALRLDVSDETSHKMLKKLRNAMLSLKSDFFILGETWHNSMPWLRGDELDSVMNYPLSESINDFWLNENMTREELEYNINRCYTTYMIQTNNVLFNLFDSHDTIRLITKLGNIDKFYQQMCVLFTMPGSPCIYYGTEIVLEGGFDPDCRRCMPWDEISNGDYDEKINNIKKLISIRKNHPAARSGDYHFTKHGNNPRLLSYCKFDKDETIEVILNCSNEEISIDTNGEILYSNKLNGDALQSNGVVIVKNKSKRKNK